MFELKNFGKIFLYLSIVFFWKTFLYHRFFLLWLLLSFFYGKDTSIFKKEKKKYF